MVMRLFDGMIDRQIMADILVNRRMFEAWRCTCKGEILDSLVYYAWRVKKGGDYGGIIGGSVSLIG